MSEKHDTEDYHIHNKDEVNILLVLVYYISIFDMQLEKKSINDGSC